MDDVVDSLAGVIITASAVARALDRRDDEAPFAGVDDPYISQILTGHHVAIQRLCTCIAVLARELGENRNEGDDTSES